MSYGCQRFVLISTDKAVNPTNIMGASKRLCEMVIQTFDRYIKEGRSAELPRLYAHEEDEDGSMRMLAGAETAIPSLWRCGLAMCSAATAASFHYSKNRSRRAAPSR